MSAAVPAVFEAVKVDYAAIAPMLVVVGGALIGVLVEAVAPRSTRYGAQLVLTSPRSPRPSWRCSSGPSRTRPSRSGSRSPSTVRRSSLQATLLVFGLLGVLAMSERFGGKSADAFTRWARLARVPAGSSGDTGGIRDIRGVPRWRSSRSSGCSSFAANDLITMFVASKFSHCRSTSSLAWPRRRRLLSQEASLKYFLLGAFSSAFFPSAPRCSTASPGPRTSS